MLKIFIWQPKHISGCSKNYYYYLVLFRVCAYSLTKLASIFRMFILVCCVCVWCFEVKFSIYGGLSRVHLSSQKIGNFHSLQSDIKHPGGFLVFFFHTWNGMDSPMEYVYWAQRCMETEWSFLFNLMDARRCSRSFQFMLNIIVVILP